jgi:hypothetical protein
VLGADLQLLRERPVSPWAVGVGNRPSRQWGMSPCRAALMSRCVTRGWRGAHRAIQDRVSAAVPHHMCLRRRDALPASGMLTVQQCANGDQAHYANYEGAAVVMTLYAATATWSLASPGRRARSYSWWLMVRTINLGFAGGW